MATNFPTSKDNFVNPQSTDSVQLVSHAAQHANANDAIEALETKVGIDGSTDPQSLEYRITNFEPAKISFTPPIDGKLGQLWFDNQTAEFYVFDGTYWVQVATPIGADGPQGPAGQGVPTGGTSGQYLTKINGTNYNTQWSTLDLSSYATNLNPTFTGTVNSGPIVVTQSSNDANYPIAIASANQQNGGTGYSDLIKITNSKSGATNPNKFIRITDSGALEIINSSYTATNMHIDNSGNATFGGYVRGGAPGSVLKDTMLSNSEVTVVSTTIATSTSDVDFITYSYTPVSSSSYLIIDFHLSRYEHQGTTDDSWYSSLKVDGTEISYNWQMVNDNGTGTSGRSGVLFPLTGRYTNSNTSAKTISIAARRDGADDSINIVNSATGMWLRITEVAR